MSGDTRGTSLRTIAGVVGAAGVSLLAIKYRKQIYNLIRSNFRGNKYNKQILVVNSREECANAVNHLKSKVVDLRVIGFDCEWVTKNGSRHPIGLVQLASHCGYCVLFRLSKIQHIPKELKELLEDISIYKVGVAPADDARYLYADYSVNVNGMIDLRYLDALISERPEGLASLALKHLKIKMDKDWRVRCSDWDAPKLSERQINYAAADAHVGVLLFKKIVDQILKTSSNKWFFTANDEYWKNVEHLCKEYINSKFKANKIKSLKTEYDPKFVSLLSQQQKNSLQGCNFKQHKRNYTRLIKKRVPYQNCFMQTTDGEVLCTCDRKKADWYVEKDIAEVISEDPFTIRLKFQPAGRCVGDVGRFYQIPRENRCVVCGKMDSYIRKNIIPKEYRRLFPSVMKDHSSHDVVLLCLNCHQESNIEDQSLRLRLAVMCNAPIYNKDKPKLLENFDVKKIKSAARALSRSDKFNIPYERRLELETVILDYYTDYDAISDELLQLASNVESRQENPSYESHGELVVEFFKYNSMGLLELERMWREHFLKCMKPKFMPELWSVEHTKSRLEIRAHEGRVNEDDLKLAGFSADIIETYERVHEKSESL